MIKKNFPLTINEGFILVVIIIVILGLAYKYVPAWRAAYEFKQINGYLKQGTIMAYDSSLRVPPALDKAGQPFAYCEKIKDLKSSFKTIINVHVAGSKYQGDYCGCPPLPNQPRVVEYKLFIDKIIYRCGREIYSTSLIPDSLKGS